MKLYVIPTETLCNASCNFCITSFRKLPSGEFLKVSDLERVLNTFPKLEKIEITGGGEPFMNQLIDDIVGVCANKTSTQLYTNGSLLENVLVSEKLDFLCISRVHYDDLENQKIMGISYDIKTIQKLKVPLKFSLLLNKQGICDVCELENYFQWAEKLNAKKVVVRQMFEHNYGDIVISDFVSTNELFDKMDVGKFRMINGNPIFNYKTMEVEFEYTSCSCENLNPVLHADGKIYSGWEIE